ncbi:MAG: hypothetical protein ACREIM_06395 [Nitrospiraceae bacterium]
MRLLIVGSGYTGSHLYASAKGCGLQVSATSRHPNHNLPHVDPDDRILFDLENPSTWSALPLDCPMIWCFPARPLALVQEFAETQGRTFPRLIVLGSTAAYNEPVQNIDRPPPCLDESAAVDHSLPRIQGEEYLRRRHGAIVLRVAGIYGPGRSPLDWIRQGRVGISDRYVNLIHVADLAGICLAMLRDGTPGEVYNVSDGMSRTWADICRTAAERWRIIPHDKRTDQSPGKRISSRKLQRALSYRMIHPDLFEALAAIEPPPSSNDNTPGS